MLDRDESSISFFRWRELRTVGQVRMEVLDLHTALFGAEKVESHFRSQHRCKGDQLKAILRLAGQSLLDPSHIPLPADGSAPIPELLVRPGYRCRLCSAYLTISKDAISTHCRTYHQLVSGQGNWEAVYLQTFMTGSNTQYWVVRN